MKNVLSRLAQCGIGAVLLASGACLGAESDDLFNRIQLLTANGATQLALRALDNSQPPVEQTENWLQAEQLRLAIYGVQGDWDALTTRLGQVPAELPLIHQHRVFTRAVEVLLRWGQGAQSRRYLRELIWRGSGDSAQTSYWRRLLVRSYVLESLLTDARIAMDRYQKDYAPTDQNWLYLHGLTLLKSGSYEAATTQLSLVQSDRARALRLLSRLRAGADEPQEIIRQAGELYKTATAPEEPDAIVIQRIWSLQAEAASKAANQTAHVKALERLFAHPIQLDVEFPVENRPIDLWQGYQALGIEIGNSANLLVGDATPWLQQAQRLKSKNKYGARAILALLALESEGAEQRDKSHGVFYDFLRSSDLEHVAISLYTDQSMFDTVDDIPHSVRHRIVRYAFQKRDIDLAARMARDLATTYAGQNPVEWKLIRARLAVYSGDLAEGETLLREIILPAISFDPDVANRIMRVLFDLQSVDHYETTYELFEMMQERVVGESQKREIYFWMADSLQGMELYERAAESYIKSASYGDQGSDIWGQTARYHAAEALSHGGMLDDARAMYEGLLRVISDPSRVMSLEKKVQELWLREQTLEGDAG